MSLPTSATSSTSSLSSRSSSSSAPDPATDAPTVWVPLSADGTNRSAGRNTLALVALATSLIFPVAMLFNVSAAIVAANHLPQTAVTILVMIGGALGTLGIPAMLSAIVTGHVALVIAKRFSRPAARRWMAIVGLVLGYLSLLTIGGVMALFILAG